MGRPSKIDRLPAEIRDAVAALRIDGHTIDEILAHLQALGLPEEDMPSRSGVGRHIQSLEEIVADVRRSRQIAEAIVARSDGESENRQARANIELAHRMAMKVLTGEPIDDPQDVQFIAKALDHLGRAAKSDNDLRAQIRKDIQAEMEKKLASAAGGKGFSAEAAQEARKIMGFAA